MGRREDYSLGAWEVSRQPDGQTVALEVTRAALLAWKEGISMAFKHFKID